MIAAFEFLLKYWKIIAVGALLTVIFGVGYHFGAAGVQDSWDKEKALMAGQVIDQQNHVIMTERANTKTGNEVSNDYQTGVSAIDNQFTNAFNGVRIGTEKGAGKLVPGLSVTSAGIGKPACSNGLSNADKALALKQAKTAEKQALRLILLKKWALEIQANGVTQ